MRLWLTLYGTAGDEERGCYRRGSTEHQVVPMDDQLNPLLRAAFNRMQYDRMGERALNTPIVLSESNMSRVFLV
ncbi:MAG: hypothetical protein HC915_04125 [Anaerolineae bacterium]|nr:hypothetical protein [Anaerolineae bacterium]